MSNTSTPQGEQVASPTILRDLLAFIGTGQLTTPDAVRRAWAAKAESPRTAAEGIDAVVAAGAITASQGDMLRRSFMSAQRGRLERMLVTAEERGLVAAEDVARISSEFEAEALAHDPSGYLTAKGLLTLVQAESLRTGRAYADGASASAASGGTPATAPHQQAESPPRSVDGWLDRMGRRWGVGHCVAVMAIFAALSYPAADFATKEDDSYDFWVNEISLRRRRAEIIGEDRVAVFLARSSRAGARTEYDRNLPCSYWIGEGWPLDEATAYTKAEYERVSPAWRTAWECKAETFESSMALSRGAHDSAIRILREATPAYAVLVLLAAGMVLSLAVAVRGARLRDGPSHSDRLLSASALVTALSYAAATFLVGAYQDRWVPRFGAVVAGLLALVLVGAVRKTSVQMDPSVERAAAVAALVGGVLGSLAYVVVAVVT